MEKPVLSRGKASSDPVTCDQRDLQAGLEPELFHTWHDFFKNSFMFLSGKKSNSPGRENHRFLDLEETL